MEGIDADASRLSWSFPLLLSFSAFFVGFHPCRAEVESEPCRRRTHVRVRDWSGGLRFRRGLSMGVPGGPLVAYPPKQLYTVVGAVSEGEIPRCQGKFAVSRGTGCLEHRCGNQGTVRCGIGLTSLDGGGLRMDHLSPTGTRVSFARPS